MGKKRNNFKWIDKNIYDIDTPVTNERVFDITDIFPNYTGGAIHTEDLEKDDDIVEDLNLDDDMNLVDTDVSDMIGNMCGFPKNYDDTNSEYEMIISDNAIPDIMEVGESFNTDKHMHTIRGIESATRTAIISTNLDVVRTRIAGLDDTFAPTLGDYKLFLGIKESLLKELCAVTVNKIYEKVYKSDGGIKSIAEQEFIKATIRCRGILDADNIRACDRFVEKVKASYTNASSYVPVTNLYNHIKKNGTGDTRTALDFILDNIKLDFKSSSKNIEAFQVFKSHEKFNTRLDPSHMYVIIDICDFDLIRDISEYIDGEDFVSGPSKLIFDVGKIDYLMKIDIGGEILMIPRYKLLCDYLVSKSKCSDDRYGMKNIYAIRVMKNENYMLDIIDNEVDEVVEQVTQKKRQGEITSISIYDPQKAKCNMDDKLRACAYVGGIASKSILPSDLSPNHIECIGYDDMFRLSNSETSKMFDDLGGDINKFTGVETMQSPMATMGFRDIVEYVNDNRGEVLLIHPFESYSAILRLLDSASSYSEKVDKIFITLYRTSGDIGISSIVKSLVKAAKQGISVNVVLEMKARGNEETNYDVASQLIDAGVRVMSGFKKYKVHSKMFCIQYRDEFNKTKFISHLATGNYNESSANMYTDISVITTSFLTATECIDIFNTLIVNDALTSDSPSKPISTFKTIGNVFSSPFSVATTIKELLIQYSIDGEQCDIPSRATFKINGINDLDVIGQIYAAANRGMKITLIVRGMCNLPSDVYNHPNIEVVASYGPLLEHSRVYYFKSGLTKKRTVLIASADLLSRNLKGRVETAYSIVNTANIDKIAGYLEMVYCSAQYVLHPIDLKNMDLGYSVRGTSFNQQLQGRYISSGGKMTPTKVNAHIHHEYSSLISKTLAPIDGADDEPLIVDEINIMHELDSDIEVDKLRGIVDSMQCAIAELNSKNTRANAKMKKYSEEVSKCLILLNNYKENHKIDADNDKFKDLPSTKNVT